MSPRVTSGAARAAIHGELQWYFVFAEIALQREQAGAVPSPSAGRLRAGSRARRVQARLATLGGRHASVLRAAYTPRRWPANVARTFDALTPLAVRLAFASDPWPTSSARAGLELAAARRLSRALRRPKRVPVTRLRRKARRLLRRALHAYAVARVKGGRRHGRV